MEHKYPSKIILFGEHITLHGGNALALAINLFGTQIVRQGAEPGFFVEDLYGNSFTLKFPDMHSRVDITLETRLGCGLGSSAIISLIIADYYINYSKCDNLVILPDKKVCDNLVNKPDKNMRDNIVKLPDKNVCDNLVILPDKNICDNLIISSDKTGEIGTSEFESTISEYGMGLNEIFENVRLAVIGRGPADILRNVHGEAHLLLNLAYNIEHLFHGRSSGIDVLTSWRCGLIHFHNSQYEEMPIEHLNKYDVVIWDSGLKKDTKSVISGLQMTDEIVRSIDEVVIRGIKLLKKEFALTEFYEIIKENQEWLEKLGIVPETMRNEVCRVRGLGIECKISGAGHGGHLVTLVEKGSCIVGWKKVSIVCK